MKKMVCACLGVRRGRNQPSQIRFVEKIKALECLSPSFYLPRALTPPTCLEEETRGGFKSGDLGGRELKEHHRTKDDPLIRREIKCNRMPSSFSGMMHLTNSMVRHLQWAHLDAQSATRARVLQRGWGYMAIIPDPSQISASPFDSHWPMVPRAFLLVSLRWCYLCSKTWLCEDVFSH